MEDIVRLTSHFLTKGENTFYTLYIRRMMLSLKNEIEQNEKKEEKSKTRQLLFCLMFARTLHHAAFQAALSCYQNW